MPLTSAAGQRADAAAPARRTRRPVCSARRIDSRAPRPDVSDRRSTGGIARRIVIAAVLTTAMVTVVLALPPLRTVGEQISRMSLAWIGVAVMLEIASYVLITRFLSPGGTAEVEDFMPVAQTNFREHRQRLVHRVVAARSEVRFEPECSPRFDYCRAEHTVAPHEHGVLFQSANCVLALEAAW